MKYNPSLHKLSNGVAVILDPMDIESTSVKVSFNTGSRDEAPHEYGITHFCEHMLCKGTKRFLTRKDITDFLQMYGGVTNAYTSVDELQFHGRILAKNLDKLIEVISDELQNSLFDSDSIELERIIILDELRRAQDDKERQESDFISKTIFNSQLYSYQTLGTAENIKSFSKQRLLDWKNKRLSAKNCTIVICGKIMNPDDVLAQLEKFFAFLPTHDVPILQEPIYKPLIAHNSANQNKNVNICIMMPPLFNGDIKQRLEFKSERRFLRFLEDELYENIRQKHGLVYNVKISKFGGSDGLHLIETESAPQNVARVTELIAQTCERVYNNNMITDEWLQRLNAVYQLGDADWFDSWKARSSQLLNYYRKYGSVYDCVADNKLGEAITVSDIVKYSRRLFDMPISIITTGPDFNADLGAIWKRNFPNSNIATASNKIIKQIKNAELGR